MKAAHVGDDLVLSHGDIVITLPVADVTPLALGNACRELVEGVAGFTVAETAAAAHSILTNIER